ncbi:MAG: D-alanyl-D-alanine carboxypeptidase family protein [Lachnospira sp.]|nr:D-alanyl-D-alanine carboxypeptidase family protein [Lachnospira sp.]
MSIIKKLTSIFIILAMITSLCACSDLHTDNDNNIHEQSSLGISYGETSGLLDDNPTTTDTSSSNHEPTQGTSQAPTQPPTQSATKAPVQEATKQSNETSTLIPTLPAVTVTSADVATFSGISYYKPDNIVNYVAYKQLNPNLSKEDVVTHVNIGLHTPFYSKVNTISNPNDLLVLCNKYNSLDANYVPADLVTMDRNYASSGQKMRKEAAEAFYKLSADAKDAGYTIMAVSTYRSYSYQGKLYNTYVARDGQTKADTYSARAGTSEHQTGLAVDVTAGEIAEYNKFGNTASYQWAKDNIHNYGFIIRYPEGKTPITGYKSEPWHFRYVGIETAKAVYESGLTYDEYYVRYLAK